MSYRTSLPLHPTEDDKPKIKKSTRTTKRGHTITKRKTKRGDMKSRNKDVVDKSGKDISSKGLIKMGKGKNVDKTRWKRVGRPYDTEGNPQPGGKSKVRYVGKSEAISERVGDRIENRPARTMKRTTKVSRKGKMTERIKTSRR